jgi:hypothetical protein
VLTMLIEFTSVVTFIMVISVGGERFYKLGKIWVKCYICYRI